MPETAAAVKVLPPRIRAGRGRRGPAYPSLRRLRVRLCHPPPDGPPTTPQGWEGLVVGTKAVGIKPWPLKLLMFVPLLLRPPQAR
jgi:hypothetical protein